MPFQSCFLGRFGRPHDVRSAIVGGGALAGAEVGAGAGRAVAAGPPEAIPDGGRISAAAVPSRGDDPVSRVSSGPTAKLTLSPTSLPDTIDGFKAVSLPTLSISVVCVVAVADGCVVLREAVSKLWRWWWGYLLQWETMPIRSTSGR